MSDGWFKTGDVAIWDEDGSYLPPAELEAVLLTKGILDVGVIKAYEFGVWEWTKPRVAVHKWVRDCVVVVGTIPKRNNRLEGCQGMARDLRGCLAFKDQGINYTAPGPNAVARTNSELEAYAVKSIIRGVNRCI
ncbi:uncharacterized protein EI90DRAFT_3012935 [Cantharellus anzutake]|uniref:uncharacterized protein n=1 Tax=Cantharellus anzutake TaxID=1750568 RepID=UPI001906B1FA|nr:uncharacterized protein EI90DRAFT_3012935 [Cantharellus anzutake]KAF8338756.1 hypothetical protein EI90DRAFT_3012935 [Cantharellus anzutake]